jgi:transglutaminase-like putative cysteine protease
VDKIAAIGKMAAMRLRIRHGTVYRYASPAKGVIQTLHLTPRNHAGQYVTHWRLEVSEDSKLYVHEDAFGNITHSFTAGGAFTELGVHVDGEVETQDTDGLVSGTIERFPPSLYLRETPLTQPDAAILAFAQDVKATAGDDTLKLLHAMLARVHGDMAFDTDPTHTTTTATEAFALKRGVCQDLTHVFISAVRSLGVPARYIGGYFHRMDGVVDQEAGHAWSEAYVPDLGWVAFDAANGISATDAHVRVAVGLDYLGVTPIRGTRYGGGSETMDVKVRIDQAKRQMQN